MNHCGPGLSLDDRIFSAAWSSTEDHIVTLFDDGILRKWSNIFEAPTLVAHSTQRHNNATFEFSPDDRFIASALGGAKLWDASNLSLIWEYTGYWNSITFHPLGKRLVFYSGRSSLDVNIEDLGNITATERQFNRYTYNFVFNPSGNMCVARTSRGVRILSADTFEEKTSLPYSDCEAIRITPNGKYVLLVLGSKKVVLWDITAERTVEELSLDMNVSSIAQISRNCRVLLAYNYFMNNQHIIHLASTYY